MREEADLQGRIDSPALQRCMAERQRTKARQGYLQGMRRSGAQQNMKASHAGSSTKPGSKALAKR
jgi:hypothetical protein